MGTQFGQEPDAWSKKYRHPSVWIAQLIQDIESGSNLVWTSIPDWVTQILKNAGYDGIIDIGGKHGGMKHSVYIPFYSNQVKSAYGNNGNYSLASNKINESTLKEKYPEGFTFTELIHIINERFDEKAIKDYVSQYLYFMGSGSSRLVYKLNEKAVLKIAYCSAGIAQNEAEFMAARQQYEVCSRVINHDPNFYYLISEVAQPLENFNEYNEIFEYYTGVKLYNLSSMLSNYSYYLEGYTKNFNSSYKEYIKNKWVRDLLKFLKMAFDKGFKYVLPGDFTRESTYGLVSRKTIDSNDKKYNIVIIDAGFTEDVFESYY